MVNVCMDLCYCHIICGGILQQSAIVFKIIFVQISLFLQLLQGSMYIHPSALDCLYYQTPHLLSVREQCWAVSDFYFQYTVLEILNGIQYSTVFDQASIQCNMYIIMSLCVGPYKNCFTCFTKGICSTKKINTVIIVYLYYCN